MHVGAKFYASPKLLRLVVGEIKAAGGGFTAAVEQLANVSTLPGAEARLMRRRGVCWSMLLRPRCTLLLPCRPSGGERGKRLPEVAGPVRSA